MIHKLKKESQEIRLEAQEKLVGYIVAAFGLIAGLAWNDAIKALIDYLFPLDKNSVWAKFGYAFLITLVVVIATVYVTKLLKRKEKEKKEEPHV
ncbi:MAG TPA: DUF5654 family protein [Candidatus Kapabacteria bacterium]|nr:DUF5654 family protein [Candidatus Kapabacteria bacterium]